MGEAFAWMLPVVQLGFGIVFAAARRAGAGVEARWWALAFPTNAAAFAAPLLGSLITDEAATVAGDALFAVAFFLYGNALLARHRRPPWRAVRLALLALAILAPAAAVAWGSLEAELVASDTTCALELAVALLAVPAWPAGRLDRAMVAVSWLVVLDNLLRTASAQLTAAGASFSTYLATPYGVLLQSTCALSGFTFGFLALSAVAVDIVEGYRLEARQDALTGLLNRRGLAEASAGQGGRGAAVVTCDLDHFKRVNDTWGHAAGDRVLVAFAGLVRRVLPPGGVAGRVGGEEFVLLLPGLDIGGAGAVADRLRRAMGSHDWRLQGIEGTQTASFGIAARLPADAGLDDVIRRADRGLYDAKRAGRDRVEVRLVA